MSEGWIFANFANFIGNWAGLLSLRESASLADVGQCKHLPDRQTERTPAVNSRHRGDTYNQFWDAFKPILGQLKSILIHLKTILIHLKPILGHLKLFHVFHEKIRANLDLVQYSNIAPRF